MSEPLFDVRTGIDLVSVDRVTRLLERYDSAEMRLFSEIEIAYCSPRRRRDEHYAARIAAKEAVHKAFAPGCVDAMRWHDVEVVNEPGGRPRVRLHGRLEALAREQRLLSLDVSLSHTDAMAVAQAVAVWERPAARRS